MLDNEKLLFDDLYEKTKDCGRVQFVELLMTKERENKELKLQLKGTTHCFDEEEHEKLKKQLENYKKLGFKYLQDKNNNLETQQKEFISYLENEIYSIEPKGTGINYNCEYDSEEDYISAMKEQSKLNTLKEILSKFKEIIGDDK